MALVKVAGGLQQSPMSDKAKLFVKSKNLTIRIWRVHNVFTNKPTMEQPPDFKSLQDAIQAALISTTRTVGQISAEDLGFQRSLNPKVGDVLDEQNSRLLAISSSILKSAAALTESNAPILQEVDDVDNKWHGIVDMVDSLLERADTCLDEYTGVIKRKTPPVEQVCFATPYISSTHTNRCISLQLRNPKDWAIHSVLRIWSSHSLLS